jgi:hypothetical protein
MTTPFVKVDTITYTTVKCKCPLCSKHEFSVGHLFNDAAKMDKGYYEVYWSCTECRAKFDIRIFADRHVEFSQRGMEENPFIPALILLRSNTGEGQTPIYAVVRTGTHKDSIDKEKAERFSSHLDYYYGQSTCPTNWFNDTIALIQDGDDDPHGCFEFVGVLDEAEVLVALKANPNADHQRAGDISRYISDNVRHIFPQAFESGNTFEAEAPLDLRAIYSAKPPANIQALVEHNPLDNQDWVIPNMNPVDPGFKVFPSAEARIGRGLTSPLTFYGSGPDTIEDSYVFPQWFVDKVAAEGNVITANGIVPKESLTQAKGEAEVRHITGLQIMATRLDDKE